MAESRAKKLYDIKEFSENQVKKIINGALRNNQVYQSYGAKPFLSFLLGKYEPIIDDTARKDLLVLMEKIKGDTSKVRLKYLMEEEVEIWNLKMKLLS